MGSILAMLIVGAVAGWLAGHLVNGGGFGLVSNVAVGVVGAFIAGYLLPHIGLSFGDGIVSSIGHATLGSVVLLVLIRLIRSGGR